jgi:serine/threonine-protein kinase
MIFGMPVFIVGITQYFKFRRLRLEKEALGSPEDRERIEAMEEERNLLEQRIQNLETIVTSVDLELNARLNRLAAHQSALQLAPPDAHGTPEGGEPPRPSSTVAEAATVAAQALSGELTVGQTLLDRFRVERLIGRGGMGAVYLAIDEQLGEQVALKVIAHSLAEDPGAVERFRREASAARRVTHPGVVRIHDLGEDGGLLFLTMEYFSGRTLAEILGRRGRLPLLEARALLGEVCDALGAAHGAGVIHRDLKPQNILVGEEQRVKIIDFGLARATYLSRMTATGLMMGSPEYMAPEQVRGGAVDGRTDIYALGAVAYHMLTGSPPFTADTPVAVGFMHCAEPPADPRELRPELPAEVAQIVLDCLAKDPAQRPACAADVKTALGA